MFRFRSVLLTTALVCTALPALAQTTPSGWTVRIDRSTNAQDPDNTPNLKFVETAKGFHVTGGPAGTFWNAKNTATGTYTVSATFTLLTPSNHTNYYGLVFGGSDLGSANQAYTYFVIAQDGTYFIRHRMGANDREIVNIVPKTPSDAVKKPGADGRSVNVLEVRVGANAVSYVLNGTVVHTQPRAGAPKTDGVAGFRVNHMLDVQIDGFTVKK